MMSESKGSGSGLGERSPRFVPAPFSPPAGEVESEATWGFSDTQFALDERGVVRMSGNRYLSSGQDLPSLVPWVKDVMKIDVQAAKKHTFQFPPASFPEARKNEAFLTAIRASLSDQQISEDGVVRLRHGHGHTQEEMYAVKYGQLGRIPDAVIYPESEKHVHVLVQAALAHNVCLIPYGGGTNVSEALRCPEDEERMIVSVDMRRMNKVLWIDPVNRMACIEAGAVGRHLTEQLRRNGYTMGHEPDSIEFSTLGGWIATNASGMKKNKYGNIEDIVLDVTAITAQGKLEHRVVSPRESTGVDPRLWLFGSEGRLGIITTAIVKLFPLPEVQRYGSVLFPDFAAGVAFMYELAQHGDWPASVRLVDNLQFQFGMALKPKSEGWRARKSAIEKFFVTKVKGYDPNQMCACTLVFEGTRAEVDRQEAAVYSIASHHRGMKAGAENGLRGYQLTYGIAYIRDFVMDHFVLAESFETSAPWSQVRAVCEGVKERVRQEHAKRKLPGQPFVTCRVTQIYETGAAVYFYFGMSHEGVEHPSEVYAEIERAAREEILKLGGSLSHHHGIGKLRQRYLPDIYSPTSLAWSRDAKRAFDPQNIFGCDNQHVAPETKSDATAKNDKPRSAQMEVSK
jgi:alkyldihydroxyacetonephosphate synthase